MSHQINVKDLEDFQLSTILAQSTKDKKKLSMVFSPVKETSDYIVEKKFNGKNKKEVIKFSSLKVAIDIYNFC